MSGRGGGLGGEGTLQLNRNILVVEDDPAVADLFQQFLPRHGYVPHLVSTAEDALSALESREYGLVLADKNLPGMDGIELVQRIKARDPALDVIVMTAYADMESMLAAVRVGVYDYLIKPFDSLDEVAQKISRAIEKRHVVLENKQLVEYLQQANEQIDAMNRELERQVRERTAQLEDANRRLAELTITDDVTALYNQRFLYRRLEEEFERARRYGNPLSVMMLDLDHFKSVNDAHDHLFGSQVLRRVGEIFRFGVRAVDVLVRYGGDEFLVLMPNTPAHEAVPLAERLRKMLEEQDVGDGLRSYKVTVSIGIAELGACGAESSQVLLRAADNAMYLAKHRGRNQVAQWDAAMHPPPVL